MTTAELLRKAKAILIERGWCQGGYVDPDSGACCMEAAVGFAISGDPESTDRDAFMALHSAAGTRRLYRWNDAEGRTKDEVLAAFDRAIAIAEQEASS